MEGRKDLMLEREDLISRSKERKGKEERIKTDITKIPSLDLLGPQISSGIIHDDLSLILSGFELGTALPSDVTKRLGEIKEVYKTKCEIASIPPYLPYDFAILERAHSMAEFYPSEEMNREINRYLQDILYKYTASLAQAIVREALMYEGMPLIQRALTRYRENMRRQ